jgi:hypothetical protein
MTRFSNLTLVILLACFFTAFLIAFDLTQHAQAQTTITISAASTIGGDQTASSLAVAQGYVYRMYLDGSSTGTILAMICTGTASPFQCFSPFPPLTPGNHTATITTASVAGGESAKSASVSFTSVVLAPSPIVNIRIQ